MTVKKVALSHLKQSFLQLGTEEYGAKTMALKGDMQYFFIQKISTPAANILKQEALSLGGDFALPKEAILYESDFYDGILILTLAQLKILCGKLKLQPFGLKQLAIFLEKFLHTKQFDIEIMGIINLTPDSFFKESRFATQKAKEKILELIDTGIEIIDIGAASSRPGSEMISAKEELERVKEIADFIYKENLYTKTCFSIDTYNFEVADFCLNRGFSILNDITGFSNPQMLQTASKYSSKCVLMHMQGNPLTMQQSPFYEDVIIEITEFFTQKILELQSYTVGEIILDVGIGFGKNLEHNCELIRNLSHFKIFNKRLLVGASRKSLIHQIYPAEIEARLPGTITIHLEALRAGANILRVHDAKEHQQAIKVWKKLQENEEIVRRDYGKQK